MKIKNYLLLTIVLFCSYNITAQIVNPSAQRSVEENVKQKGDIFVRKNVANGATNKGIAAIVTPFSQRLAGGNMKLKGDIVFVGNNIVNRTDPTLPSYNAANVVTNQAALTAAANIPYNGPKENNDFNFDYIDIDGDPTTFSSSTADLNITDQCKKIVYAGLYWTATYPFERIKDDGTILIPRQNDWNQIKFKLPGGAYQTIVADNVADPVGQEDDIIVDNNTSNANGVYGVPYVCYRNVTSLLQGLADANGTYGVANQRGQLGKYTNTGSSGGWSIVIIYESPSLPSKNISIFDGYATIDSNANVDFSVSGFVTLPIGFPVKARIGVGALEGDKGYTGDNLKFKANLAAGFTTITNTLNPFDNFFNSSITNNNVAITNRNINSSNTLGFDLDLVQVNNPGNTVVPNNETGATIRLTTNGDSYGAYLVTFDVEIIEPKIVLTKTVADISGVDIGGGNVTLGQPLNYTIGFQNIGNDATNNFTITDVLPINVTFNPASVVLPPPPVTVPATPPITFTYNAATRTIVFTIPNGFVTVNAPRYTIQVGVRVVDTCDQLDDACSNIVTNQAFATYQGVLNTAQISNDPSLSSYSVCNLNPPSPTNFLVGLDDCNFTTAVTLCGNNPVTLTAANGYSSYVWSGPGTITPVAGTNNQSVTVNQIGTYTVNDIINLSPCKSIVQTFNVTDFGSGALTNPVIPYADSILICPTDGLQLPLIFLCGAGDSQLIQTNISGATSIVWQQLTGACGAYPAGNCANQTPGAGCAWTTVATGANYSATAAGQYSVTVNYPNGCFRTFYFNVFQNLLNPIATPRDIVCNTKGQITITNVPAGYEYQLNCAGAWQASNVFPNLAAGIYSVCIRQVGVAGACVFTVSNIPIRAHNFTVSTILTQPICTGDKGSINIAANDVNPQYNYSIYQEPAHILVNSVVATNASSYVFGNLPSGNYSYQVTTQDGCNGTGLFTINTPPAVTVTAAITKPLTCTAGEITVYPGGGSPPYNYIVTGAVTVTQSSPVITATVPGIYNIQIFDNNNCTANTSITVATSLPPAFNITHTDISCSNSGNTGSISINVTNPNGSSLMYSINNGVTFSNSSVFSGLAPGTYNVVVQYTLGTSVCATAPQAVTITIPNPIVGISTLTTPYTCTSSGVITVSGVAGGTPGYTYSIDGVTFQAGTTFTITAAGTYVITIKDSKGCTFTTLPIVVPALNPPTDLDITIHDKITCPTLTGTLNVNLPASGGGLPPIRFRIKSPPAYVTPFVASGLFAGLPAGTYCFEVIDRNGCTYEECYTFLPPPPAVIVPLVKNNVKCFGTATGNAQFTISGMSNSTNYSYTITPPGTTVNGATPAAGSTTFVVPLNNLAAGTYTISLHDDENDCDYTSSLTIAGPASALTTTLTVVPIKCAPSSGQVTVNASGGWGGYTYTLTPPAGPVVGPQSSNLFSGLTLAGTYTVSTLDSGGCTITNNFTLTAPTPPTATISPLSDFCYDSLNGATLIVNASSGTPGYQYSINGQPYQASNTFPNLTPGNYTITVMDSFGCTFVLPVQTIKPQLQFSTSLIKDLDCTASPSATIQGTITLGTGYAPYTYQVSINSGPYTPVPPGIAIAGNVFNYTAAAAGTYQFMVTDSKGCTAISGITTINPLIPVAATVVKTDNKCFGDASGTVTITPSGGVGPYQIQFGALPFSATTTYTNLAAGTYNYVVKDSKSCTFNGSVTITQPTQITYTAVVNPISCNPAGGPYILGSICVNGLAGGTAGYTYTLVDLTGGGPNQVHVDPAGANYCFPNIDFGIYDLIVTDANGCTVVKSNLIMSNPPNDLTFVIAGSVPSCALGATVTVTLVGAIGPGPFEFGIVDQNIFPWSTNFVSASNPPFTNVFTGLTPGAIYTIVVRDVITHCYYFEQMSAPTATNSTMNVTSLVPNNVTCRGAANGSVTFNLSGINAATTSISYNIHYASNNLPVGTPGSSGIIVLPGGLPATIGGNLPPGTYNIQLVEIGGAGISGCGITSPIFTITQSATALALTATTKNDNCKLNAGQIIPIASGGTGPYSYQYITPVGGPLGAWVTTNPFYGETGIYDVYVKDANGCIVKISANIGLDTTPVINALLDSACAAEGSFAINVTLPTPGVAPHTYSVDGGIFQPQTAPFTISGLSSGVHTVEVNDINGCGNKVTVTISPPLNLSTTITALPTCANNDGVITVNASGGSGSYVYSMVPMPASVTLFGNVFSGIPAGAYDVSITDAILADAGGIKCKKTVHVVLSAPTLVTFSTNVVDVTCNGSSNGSITVILPATNDNPPYTYQITAGPILFPSQASNVFSGLPAGNYTVVVTSGRVCKTTQIVTVNQPLALAATASLPPVVFSCTGNVINTTTLTITVTPGTGTPAYSYSIDGVNYFPGNTFSIAGTNAVQTITYHVKDANGCPFSNTISIPAYVPLQATYSATTISCLAPSVLTITASGGTGSYSYQVLPAGAANVTQGVAPNDNVFTISGPGQYTFQVTDTNSTCFVTTVPYNIAPYDIMTVTATATKPVMCYLGTDGQISITIANYSGPYTYNLLDSTGTPILPLNRPGNTAVPLVINVGGGNYSVQVFEGNSPSCDSVSNTVTVASPSAQLIVDAQETANVTCSLDKGVIVATASGGWGTYTYTMTIPATLPPGAIQTGNVFSNLPPGSYTISVKDLLNCSASDNVVLVAPGPIVDPSIAASTPSVSCFGDNTASITIPYPAGGQGSNYSYIFSTSNPTSHSGPINIPVGASTTISGLGADTYDITIIDGYGCSLGPISITITEPQLLSSALTITKTQTCSTNTTLTLTGTGGTLPYNYSTNPGGPFVAFAPAGSSSTQIIVPPGTYTYYIKDANGCLSNASGVTIDPLTPLAFSAPSHVDINCPGDTGSLSITASGGLSNYVYTLYTGAGVLIPGATQPTPGTFTNLPAGTYIVHVLSGLDCNLDSNPITISEPPTFVVTETPINVSCFQKKDGVIHLVITGATTTVQYTISTSPAQAITIPNPAGGFDITGLAAGSYTVVVFDLIHCPQTFVYTITEPVELTASAASVINETCFNDASGSVTIQNITGGTGPYFATPHYVFHMNTAVTPAVLVDDSNYVPINNLAGASSHVFQNLTGGFYLIHIKDSHDCYIEFNSTVGAGPDFEPYIPPPTFHCPDKTNNLGVSITVQNFKNPPSLAFTPAADYTFSLDVDNPAIAQPSNVFTSATSPGLLIPGNHTVFVYNSSGANICKHSYVVNVPSSVSNPLQLTLQQGPGLNEITAITTNPATGQPSGTQPYEFVFDGHSTGTVNTYIYDHSGDYTVSVTDYNNCYREETLHNLIFIPIDIPTIFTPNGDGTNEGWKPLNTSNYKDLVTKIYDRYGRMVAELVHEQSWDGKYNNQELPSGDYWYVLKVDGNNDKEYVGHFTLYR